MNEKSLTSDQKLGRYIIGGFLMVSGTVLASLVIYAAISVIQTGVQSGTPEGLAGALMFLLAIGIGCLYLGFAVIREARQAETRNYHY